MRLHVLIILCFLGITLACKEFDNCDDCVFYGCIWVKIPKGFHCFDSEVIIEHVTFKISSSKGCSKFDNPLPTVEVNLINRATTSYTVKYNVSSTSEVPDNLKQITRPPITPSTPYFPESKVDRTTTPITDKIKDDKTIVLNKQENVKQEKSSDETSSSSAGTWQESDGDYTTKQEKSSDETTPSSYGTRQESDAHHTIPSTNDQQSFLVKGNERRVKWIRPRKNEEFHCPIRSTQELSDSDTEQWELDCLLCYQTLEIANIKRIRQNETKIEQNLYGKRLRRCMINIRF